MSVSTYPLPSRLRRLLWRLGRRVYMRARGEVANRMEDNGELALQSWVMAALPDGPLECMDIGANVGDWTIALATKGIQSGRQLLVHAFEPVPSTFATLQQRIQALGLSQVRLYNQAVGDEPGETRIHVLGPDQERNSLFPPMGGEASTPVAVQMTSVDEFLDLTAIQRLHLVKCDTEGQDAMVLAGASRAFASGRIVIFQFEYNERWIQARRYLFDIFTFIKPLPYRLGRLTPWGVEWFRDWNPELDRFFESNYVLAHHHVVAKIPGVDGAFDRFGTYTTRTRDLNGQSTRAPQAPTVS